MPLPQVKPRTRAAVIVCHALDRLWLALVAAGVLLVFTFLFNLVIAVGDHPLGSALFDRLAVFGTPMAWLLLSIGVVGLFRLGRARGVLTMRRRLGHWGHWVPLWWTSLSACAMALIAVLPFPVLRGALALPPWIWHSTGWLIVPMVTLAFLSLGLHGLVCLYWWVSGHRPSPQDAKPDPALEWDPPPIPGEGSLEGSGEAFLAWARNDRPVETTREDQFGTRLIAWRMARQIKTSGLATQAVVGPLGAGKSTIGRFLKEYLDTSPGPRRIRLVQIELWPYLTPEAALAGILERILQEMAQEAEVVHLWNLPRRYVDLLVDLPGVGPAIARLLAGAEPTPTKLLDRMDDLAILLNLAIVVWIDDLERFARLGVEGDSAREADKLSPIRALLHALGEKQAMTVVVASTSLAAGFDLDKIARFIHEVPTLPPGKTATVLCTFRDQCLAGRLSPAEAKNAGDRLPEQAWIDPTPPALFLEFRGAALDGDHQQYKDLLFRSGGFLSAPQATVLLCRTPRALKQAVRRVHDLWEVGGLKGEVQFDQLLALCLLREGCPTGFSRLRDHWERLQQGPQQSHRFIAARVHYQKLVERPGLSEAGIHQALANPGANEDAAALSFLHAMHQSGLDAMERDTVLNITEFLLAGADTAGPQRLGRSKEREDTYWHRVVDEVHISTSRRDQTLMKQILRATPEGLADFLADQESAAMVLDFEDSLQPSWQGVLPALVRHHWDQDFSLQAWAEGHLWVQTLDRILRGVHRQNRLFWDFFHEFREAMREAIDLNLDLAVQLEFIFLRPDVELLWSEDQAKREQASVRAHAPSERFAQIH